MTRPSARAPRSAVGDLVGVWRLTEYLSAGQWSAVCASCSRPTTGPTCVLRERACLTCAPRTNAMREVPVPVKSHGRAVAGTVVGEWECVEPGRSTASPRWACQRCGHQRTATLAQASREACARCHGVTGHRAIPRHVEREAQDLPDLTRWISEDSPEAWAWIDATIAVCGPMGLEEIALAIGVSRQRVDQIQAGALRKLAAACARYGLSAEDAIGSLRGESTLPDHEIPGTHATHVRSYHAAERAARAEAPPDCEPGEPMAAAGLAELERLERRLRAVHAVLDCAAELDIPAAAE